MRKGTLFLVDGSSNLYRSYYAIRGLTSSAGLATNAAYGFTQTLRKLLKDQRPDAIAVAFDVGATTFRHRQFEDYKKDRKPMPDDLSIQIPFVYEILEGFRIPVIGLPDYEADDLIGSLACSARQAGYRVVIATSDKDFFQLVGEGISLYHTSRDVIYDENGVREVFGLAPGQVVDVMAIWGDAIDNIPGVPGIGEKGAKSLISQFGSLENLYQNLDQVKKASQRKALEEHRDQAFLSRELATIKCDLVVDVRLEELAVREPDRARLHDVFSRLEFVSLMQEYLPEAPEVVRDYRLVASADELTRLIGGDEPLAFHLELEQSEGFEGRPLAIAFSPGLDRAIVVSLAEATGSIERAKAVERLFAGARPFVTHDAKLQLRRIKAAGWAAPAARIDDVMIASYVLNPGLPSHELATIARDRLQRNVTARREIENRTAQMSLETPDWVEYLGEKSDVILGLWEKLAPELERDASLREIYDRIELPLIPVLAKMEQRGIRIDVEMLAEMSKSMGQQIEALEEKIYREAGEVFNINSPAQLATILFEKLQYPAQKKTQKTKSYSTGVEVLRELASHGYAVPQLILEHRELHKLRSTYVDALPQLVGSDGRVHTSFNQAVAATGRLSSSDPNLQNIPIRTAQGREIRRAFIADEGNVLLAADYSQIELRVLAHVADDPDLIETFRRGADIHRATAAKIFGVSEIFVTPDQRRASKTINFGVLYGMSAFRLSHELGISTGEAKEFIDSYFARYPRIREYVERTLEEARTTGKVATLFGRVRYIPEIHNRSWTVRGNAERMAVNAPIQGTAADLLKLAMIALDRRLAEEAHNEASMLLTVHDEIVIELPEGRAEEISSIVKTTMETIHPLSVPLAVDTCWGTSWYEAKE
ncbi:MAG TPA: DNA polymerase I [Thermoanaerobaculia bacterium]|nr:DNA polymerase I [Thermoanaerobaculia bacterium]